MSEYRLYYAGYNKKNDSEQIGVAVSDDLLTWRRVGEQPIVPLGFCGEADATQTSNPCVIREDAMYRMWYQGRAKDGRISICHAFSDDGLHWKDGSVVKSLSDSSSFRSGFHHPHVLRREDTYRMWYVTHVGNSSHISYAESGDGLTWSVKVENILEPKEAWEGFRVYYPWVSQGVSGYEMWYTGRRLGKQWALGRASSQDGIAWIRDHENPLIPRVSSSRVSRMLADIIARMSLKTWNAYGSASCYIFEERDGRRMFTHDVGGDQRLSISLYKENGGEWMKIASDILSKNPCDWDAYFQADPYLLII